MMTVIMWVNDYDDMAGRLLSRWINSIPIRNPLIDLF